MRTTEADAVKLLCQDWLRAGLGNGDTVLVHSSIRRTLARLITMGCKPNCDLVIESLIQAVGNDGTLLFPLFNFDFTSGTAFNIAKTQSQMGALTESARLWKSAVRTGHPIYSFAVIGAAAEKFRSVNNFSGYGADSPFAILNQMKGKIAVIDLPDSSSMTFYHHIEEMLNVPYRYHKTFSAHYYGWDGIGEDKTYGLFVRDLVTQVFTDVNPMGEKLWSSGYYSGDRPGEGSGMRVIKASDIFEACKEVILAGKAEGLLYRFGP
jgi:aminoglycoside 3-N-acetyltransferase